MQSALFFEANSEIYELNQGKKNFFCDFVVFVAF